MTEVIRLAAVAVAAALCAVTVRKQAPEIALVLSLCAGALILSLCAGALTDVVDELRRIAEYGGLSPDLLGPVIKVVGIAVVTNLAAEICKDAKEGGLASAVETAGTILGLLAVLPLAGAVLSLLSGLL